MSSQFAGGWRVHQVARIVGAHLEQHTLIELAQRRAVSPTVHRIERVAPDQSVNADVRAVTEQSGKQLCWTDCRFFTESPKAQIVIGPTQVTETAQVVD